LKPEIVYELTVFAVGSIETEPIRYSPAAKLAAAMPPTSWLLGVVPSLLTMRPVSVAPRWSVITLPGMTLAGTSAAVKIWKPPVETETVALKTA
jgi:hypothetical protein